MGQKPNLMRQVVISGGVVIVALLGAGFLVPVPHSGEIGPTGSDCRLMAKALRDAGPDDRPISSAQRCDWRALGLSNAVAVPDAYGYFQPGRTVEPPIYSWGGLKADVDVGVVLAALAGEGRNCPYYRFFGTWHRGRCSISWIA